MGVQVGLAQAQQGKIVLSHKPGRISNFEEQVRMILSKGTMDFKAALSIRGKVFFSEGHVFGRVAAPVVHMLSRLEGQPEVLMSHDRRFLGAEPREPEVK